MCLLADLIAKRLCHAGSMPASRPGFSAQQPLPAYLGPALMQQMQQVQQVHTYTADSNSSLANNLKGLCGQKGGVSAYSSCQLQKAEMFIR